MMGPNGSAFGVQYVQQTIRFAAEIGCPMVDTVDGAFETPGLSFDEVFRVTCDNYRQCLSWAEDYGVIINVETHGPYTSNLEFMTRLFEHFDSPYLRFNFDTGNTFIAGKDPLEFCKALRKYLTHCHIKDVSPALAAAVRGEETGIGSLGGAGRRRGERREHQGRDPLPEGNRLGRRRIDRVPRLRREHPQEPGVHGHAF